MDISSSIEFPAAPERVFAMMTDKAYLEEVCQATSALSYEVSVHGSMTRSRRTLPAPASAARFTGPELTVVEEVSWNEGDGSTRTGAMKMSVPGQPVTLNGKITLTPGGAGTVATLTGQLKVSIPLLGRKIEESAAPAVLAGFRTQQGVGARWLD